MNYNKSVWVDVFSEKDFRRYRKGRIVAKLINIGFGNVVNSDKIIAVVSPEAAPVKRMVQRAKESNRIIDATQGRRTKAVLITGEEFIILSALQPETISRSFNGGWETEKERGESENEKRNTYCSIRFFRSRKRNTDETPDGGVRCPSPSPQETRVRARKTAYRTFSVQKKSLTAW